MDHAGPDRWKAGEDTGERHQPAPDDGEQGAGRGQPVPAESELAARGFQRLDPRVVGLWRLSTAIGYGLLLVFLLIGKALVAVAAPALAPYLAVAYVTLVLAVTGIVCWYPRRAYRAWGYRMDARVLEISSGVVFRVSQLLPLSRLQRVDLWQGPLERLYGLASLVLHTAGTQAATVTLPGLDAAEAARLRDQLLEAEGDDAV